METEPPVNCRIFSVAFSWILEIKAKPLAHILQLGLCPPFIAIGQTMSLGLALENINKEKVSVALNKRENKKNYILTHISESTCQAIAFEFRFSLEVWDEIRHIEHLHFINVFEYLVFFRPNLKELFH